MNKMYISKQPEEDGDNFFKMQCGDGDEKRLDF